MYISIINGPNLNELHLRDKDLYGGLSLTEIQNYTNECIWNDELIKNKFQLEWFQSNHEGAIVDVLQKQNRDDACLGLVINPAAYSHTSLAISDCLEYFSKPKIEVHLSNLQKRDSVRQQLLTAKNCDALMTGLAKQSYYLAIKWIDSVINLG